MISRAKITVTNILLLVLCVRPSAAVSSKGLLPLVLSPVRTLLKTFTFVNVAYEHRHHCNNMICTISFGARIFVPKYCLP